MAIPSKLTKFIRKSFADGPWAIRGGKTTLAWDLRSAKSEEAKPAPLGQNFDGPFAIVEHLGTSSVKVRVASYADGTPRYEVHHWNNCKIPNFEEEPFEIERPALGRKRKSPVHSTD